MNVMSDIFLFKRMFKIALLLLFPMFTSSCITNAVLNKGQQLYTGAIIKIYSDTTIEDKGKVKGKLKSNAYPLPNTKFAGLPVRMWVFQIMGEPKKRKGLKYYLKYQYGEPPVLLQSVPIEDVTKSMHDLLKANGFLDSKVTSNPKKTWPGTKKYKIVYNCFLKPPYHINEITNAINDTGIYRLSWLEPKKTLIHPGDRYSLDALKGERERINTIAKRNGYFYFSDQFILFKADSVTVPGKKINLTMQLKDGIDPINLNPWYVNSVLVREKRSNDSVPEDTTVIRGVTFSSGKTFRPKVLRRFILFSKDELLTSINYNASVKNLSSITAFEFTNMDFGQNMDNNTVDITIDMVPYKRNNLQAGVNMVTKTNDFAGPGAEVRYLNRNLLKGAEQFTVKVNAGIEGWITRDTVQTIGNYNYDLGTSVELNVPRLLLVNASLLSPWYVPYTNFTLEMKYINQMRFYRMSVFRASYGYRWSETEQKKHSLNLADISYQRISARTARFIALSKPGSLLASSFANQFMIGTNYSYQNMPADNDPRQFKIGFIGFIESAGHLIYALQRLTGTKKGTDSVYNFLGSPYSEYIKTSIDARFYYNISKGNKLATRIYAGIGIPMGNSGILPNFKQYFAGGSNSVRAFKPRTLGPGTYVPQNVEYPNQTGDIRLEYNIEDRIKLAKQLELALFLDVGNIWLARPDPDRPGSQFSFDNFFNQLAVGWGWGLRYLNQFFILRVDVGYPINVPNPVIEKNSVLNLAIGYPF